MKPELLEVLPDMLLFVAVAKAESFTRAARALSMPVSTVSRRVAELEARLGVQLLSRTTRRVVLSDIGGPYFERCRTIVEAAEAAQSELQGRVAAPRGRLRISATPDFALAYLTPVFESLALRFPEISYELDLTPRSVDLIAENFDVAIRMGQLPDSQLVARKLGASARGLYASPTYLARAGDPKAPDQLSRHACVRLLRPDHAESHWVLQRGRSRVEVEVSGRFMVNNIRFMLELGLQGLGIVVIDDAIASPEAATGKLVRVLPEWSPPAVPVHALTPGRLLSAKTELLLDALTEHLQGPRPTGSRGR